MEVSGPAELDPRDTVSVTGPALWGEGLQGEEGEPVKDIERQQAWWLGSLHRGWSRMGT